MTTITWYKQFDANIHDKAAAWNLNEEQTRDFAYFVRDLARDQFKAGNRSGASWALEQARKKIAEGQTI